MRQRPNSLFDSSLLRGLDLIQDIDAMTPEQTSSLNTSNQRHSKEFSVRYSTEWIVMILILLGTTVSSDCEAAKANPSDIAQATKFLASLPAACAQSSQHVGTDGAVNIRVLCDGNGKTMDGLVVIKDGIVTKIR